jgi:4-hydroxy-4-methyl-2-oxoglutarate aldolase
VARNVVVTKVERCADQVIAGLGEAGVAAVHEAIGKRGLLEPAISPIQRGSAIAGSAVTVLSAPGDNLMVHAAVEQVEPGDILVVATTSPSTDGMVGELIAVSLMKRGCRGLIIGAGVRDVAALRAMGFPVWSQAIHAQGTEKRTPGSVNVPVVIGGVAVRPGDVVVADDDGVVVVEREQADGALTAALARIEKEAVTRASLEAGELGLDLYGLRERLANEGVEWVDGPETRE